MQSFGNLKRLFRSWRLALLIISSLLAVVAGSAAACPICGVPTVTLTERLARADVALLVQWVSAKPAKGAMPESTTFEIVEVHRDTLDKFKAGQTVSVGQLTNCKAGNLYLLMGQKIEKQEVKWEAGPAQPVSKVGPVISVSVCSSRMGARVGWRFTVVP